MTGGPDGVPTQVVLVPGVLALLPQYASLDDPVADLRAACLAAVGSLGPRVRVVAPPGGSGERVARHLLGRVGATSDEHSDAVLVVGNGSAKLTERAPGHLDPRAEPFDAEVRRALLAPDPAALAAIDAGLAAELWADAAGLRALGGLVTPDHAAEATYDAAPYGVQYWVVRWSGTLAP